MNNIVKKENNREPATFGSVVDQIFRNNLNRFFDDENWGFTGLGRSLNSSLPPTNVRETDRSYEMELVAPGLKKDDFKLGIEGDMLTVSYQPEAGKEERKEDGWFKMEYRKQAFSRSFSLDDTVDTAKISARYENGVLHLELPKKENARRISRTINIQ
ncbi:MAG: Hsp20/alpha crystallin family protein [Bacteroidota bacterium]|nr:Hsp20/alpha crystallin family protein [Bacteroidota bacterium]MDP4250860.1 Hsp20/alpha crystallin family protein [Bacteroidota bacterium]